MMVDHVAVDNGNPFVVLKKLFRNGFCDPKKIDDDEDNDDYTAQSNSDLSSPLMSQADEEEESSEKIQQADTTKEDINVENSEEIQQVDTAKEEIKVDETSKTVTDAGRKMKMAFSIILAFSIFFTLSSIHSIIFSKVSTSGKSPLAKPVSPTITMEKIDHDAKAREYLKELRAMAEEIQRAKAELFND